MTHRLSSVLLAIPLLFPLSSTLQAQPPVDYLAACCGRQVPDHESGLRLVVREVEKTFWHAPRPWMRRDLTKVGEVVLGPDRIVHYDTVLVNDERYPDLTQYVDPILLHRDYRGRERTEVRAREISSIPLVVARYSPILLLDHLRRLDLPVDLASEQGYALYRVMINDTDVCLAIRTSDSLLERVTTVWHDGMLGDMSETIRYGEFSESGRVTVPRRVTVEKVQGTEEEVEIVEVGMVGAIELPLKRPEGYGVVEEKADEPEVRVTRISDHLHTIDLLHTESRTLLVEFRDFCAVIDVPFDSRNGELVLAEAERIAPGKPVRIYAFGHHHPWYLGGVRPFVHHGATVLVRPENVDYVRYLATAPHALSPDALHLDPRPLKAEVVDSILTISDGDYRMDVVHIGMESAHTEDYLLFWFPEEKVLMHGDLAWIPAEGEPGEASSREEGLYRAIRDRGLDVETIIQTWPVGGEYGVRTIYPFGELERKVGE